MNRLGFAACLLVGLASLAPCTEAHSRAFGPRSTVHISRPTLRWQVWPGRGSQVTDALMTINGRDVQPLYSATHRELRYTPPLPLPAGDYRVTAKVVVDGRLPVKREWSFRIVPEALRELPAPNALQIEGFKAANKFRRAMGLPDFELDDRLCAAAQRHSMYLAKNNRTGHYQTKGEPLFLGKSPGERLDAFGFSDDSWEGVNFGANSPAQSVTYLFHAPYHRLPFMQPGSPLLGAGFSGSRFTLEFQMTHKEGTVTSPSDGQRQVPTTWNGNERPDPLRMHRIRGEVGYPIVFAHFTPSGEKIVVKKATLTTALGRDVPIVVNKPANDEHLQFAAILIPRNALRKGTGYVVTVTAETKSGRDISATWRFVTSAR